MLRYLITKLFVYLVKLYQYLISPTLPNVCRFLPTCSDYTIEAIKIHGPFHGIFLGIKRIFTCHPLSKKNGIDNVPKKKNIKINS